MNILPFLAGVCHKCGSFTDWLLKFHSLKPSSATQPWKAVVYVDEVHPGNILNSSGRKAWCCYMSFLELGSMLSKEDLWICLFVVRSSEVQLLEAGISQVVRLLLERLFAHDQPQTGVLLSSAKGNVRLFFTLGMFLQDGAAQKAVWANRQDSGSKPCMLCKNLFHLRHDHGEGEPADKIFSQYVKYSQLDIAKDDELLEAWSRIEAKSRTSTAKEFQRWQQASGISWSHHALMASPALKAAGLLKPASLYCFDWMHGLCSNGVLNDIVFAVLESLDAAGYKVWDTLHSWLALWVLPQQQSSFNLSKLFEKPKAASCRKARHFKCSASEMLTLYKPLQYFLEVMFSANNVMLEVCACFDAWAQVLDFLVSIPHLPNALPADLLTLVENALEATKNAGYGEEMKPKHHWTLHYSDCFGRWRQMPACWAMERKHKLPRRYGSAHCNLSSFDKGVLTSVTVQQIHTLLNDTDLFNTSCHLINPRPLPKKLVEKLKELNFFFEGLQSATGCKLASGSSCSLGDVVFLQGGMGGFPWRCGKVKHLLLAGVQVCLLEMFTFIDTKGKHATMWHSSTDCLELALLEELVQPVVHNFGKNGKVTCLTPAPLSCFK